MRILLLSFGLVVACGPDSDAPTRLRVAVWSTNVAIRDRVTLKSGAEINLVVEPVEACHLYVVRRGPGDTLTVLFPKAGASSKLKGPRSILEGKLDTNAGIESLHVIAAHEPLKELEQAIVSNEPDAIAAAVDAVRRRHERVTASAARPAPIGGLVRGSLDALEYTFTGVFCHTYTVDHR